MYTPIWSAFLAGRATVEATGQLCGDYDYICQRPWLDDNGDAWFDTSDSQVAQGRGLAASFGSAIAPYIDWVEVSDVTQGRATIRVQVRDDGSVARVWARVFAPSFTPPETPDGSVPIIEVPEVELSSTGSDIYQLEYSDFIETGVYQVVVYALDDEGNAAMPKWVEATGTGEAFVVDSVLKTVTPQAPVEYGDELTYTLLISATPGARVGLYDPLTDTIFARFVEQPPGVSHAGGVITGTLTVTPSNQITVSFAVQVGVPGTVGWTVTVTNRACVYPFGGTLGGCVWSNEVTNSAFRPYTIYLPMVLRNHTSPVTFHIPAAPEREADSDSRRPPGLAALLVTGLHAPLFDTTASGVITQSTTWTLANSPYTLTGDVVVNTGVTLTIEPGVVVKGQSNVELQVLGHLKAEGTALQPITFTSAADSGPNEWSGLVFDGGTGDLRHVTVRYGGDQNSVLGSSYSPGSNITVRNVLTGEVRIENSQVLDEYGYATTSSSYKDYGLYVKDSRVVVSGTLFSGNGYNSNDYALYATGASTVLTATGNTFQNNNGYGLYTTDNAAAWVSDSTFSGNGNYPLRTGAYNLHRTLSGNTFSGNSPNRLLTRGTLEASTTFPGTNGLAGYELEGDLSVPAGMTLTVQPGAAVKGRGDTELKVLGHLEAMGEAGQPITFTSTADSGPNEWAGLVFDGGTGELRYVTVRYGGDDNNSVLPDWSHGSNIAARDVLTGEVRIESSQVLDEYDYSSYTDYGLYVSNSRVVVSDTLFSGNGNDTSDYALYATGSSTVTMQRVTVADNAGDGIHFASGSTPNVTIINSAIRDNGGHGLRNASGVRVDARGNWWGDASGPGGEGPGTGDEISGNVNFYPWLPDINFAFVVDIYDAGDIVAWRDLSWVPTSNITVAVRVGNTPTLDIHWIDWSVFTSMPVDLSGLPPSRYLEWFILSITVPGPEAVVVGHDAFTYTTIGGLISGDTTWRAADAPYLVAGNNILVNQGTTLNIEPGVTVWFSDTRAMQVDGTLIALGTVTQPIIFTSWYPQGQKDDWGGIAFSGYAEDASFDGGGNYLGGSALQYVTVEYAGAGIFDYAVDAPDTAVYVDHCTIHQNGAGGLRVGGNENYLTNNTVSHNDGTGIYNAGSSVSISDNTVSDNTASGSGGGIYDSGSGTVSHNTVTGNAANSDGGGIYNSGGGTVSDNTITGNRASSRGGGIYSSGGTVSNNTVTGNEAYSDNSSYGGGIYSSGGAVSHNTVTTNTAHARYSAYGGGIYSSGVCTVSNNIVAGNAAYYTEPSSSNKPIGGGIYSVSGGMVENNEVRSNSASGDKACAGGIYISDGSLRSNIVISNTAQGNVGGVYWVSTAGEMLYNTVVSNTASGNTGGIFVLAGYPTINHNGISANSGYALYNNNPAGDTRLDARYNWWGTTNEATIRDLIYDWFDNFNVGFVDYNPYLFSRPNLSPAGINLSGPTAGLVNTSYSFDASVYPIAAVKPVTYVWRVSESANQRIVTHTVNVLYDAASFTWNVTGTKFITVTASNREGVAIVTHTIDIASSSSSDAYEVDDTCAQAHDITTDGSTQLHTFHATGDVDWATFQAVTGTTYVIEATTAGDSEADVSLELYDACDGTPGGGQDHSFSPDVSLTFDAPHDGPFYLRLADEGGAAGTGGTAYYLSVRGLSQAPDPGVVVLVARKIRENDPLQPNIYNVTNGVYRLFLANGYTSDRIYYLAPDTGLDADGDGSPDVDQLSTKNNLEQAITQWAQDNLNVDQPFTLYMMDHGGYDIFYLNLLTGGPETVTPPELNGWLDQLEAAAPGVKVNVIYEACRSGSFIDLAHTVSKAGRVVIGSTGAYPVAYASQTGAVFSDAFVAALGRGMSLNSSFAEARWTLQQAHPDQTPWLDDNGNGVPNEVEDGQEAARRGFAYAGTFDNPEWPPYILQAIVRQAEGMLRAQVQVQEGKVVSSTWVLIYPPSYQPPPPGEDMVRDEDDPNVDKVTLQDPDEDGIFTASYNFVEEGTYRVVIYAVDDRGLSARPREASHETTNHPPTTPFNPVPVDGTTSVPITQTLRWQGGDIDDDPVTYTVAFGTVSPPPVVATDVTTTTFDPGPLSPDTTYYWAITATDGLSVSVGATWHFATVVTAPSNRAPYTPADPIPANGATSVPITQTLSWQGGDPDGDPVTYTVAFGPVNPPPVVVTDVTTTTYDPGPLSPDTAYYWRIIATDGLSVSVGAMWRFTTAPPVAEGLKVYLPVVVRNHTPSAIFHVPAAPESLQGLSPRLRPGPGRFHPEDLINGAMNNDTMTNERGDGTAPLREADSDSRRPPGLAAPLATGLHAPLFDDHQICVCEPASCP